MQKTERKSFWALIFTQFWGAFNDNLLKVVVQLLIVQWVFEALKRQQLVNLATTVFDIPFLLFSMIAGRVADRYGKNRVIRGVQVWQVVVVAVAVVSILEHSIPAMLGSLALLSMQAAFFSPAKYGVLPELMGEGELSNGNGILNTATFVAILVGTIAGSLVTGHLWIACGLLIFGAVAGLIGSFFIEELPPAKPTISFNHQVPWLILSSLSLLGAFWMFSWKSAAMPHRFILASLAIGSTLVFFVLANGRDLLNNWRVISQDRALKLGVIAVNYFWFVGALLLTNLFLYAKEMMHVDAKTSGLLLVAVTVGIALGSLAAGKWSKGKVELGLVPIGALGMSIFVITLMWSWHSLAYTLIDLFLVGFFAGLYEIPLNALIQWRSPETDRGSVLATQNFLSFLAILGASGALWVLGSFLQLNPAQVLFAMGLISLLGSIIVYAFVPDAVWRLVIYVVTTFFYDLRIVGGDRVPVKGPALLVSNHLSLADGFLVGAAVPRLVRFLIWRPYYEAKWGHWLMRTMKAIPISENDPPKEILRSLLVARKALEEGEVVCLFAEGQISRTGNLLEFKRGFETIIKGLDVPVIPVNLDRVWGSIFSFEHGKAIFKMPKRIPYPVTVSFGEPVRGAVNATTVRQAVLDLSAQAFDLRLAERKSLPIEFLKRAKQQPGALAVADSSGLQMSYSRLAAVTRQTAKALGPQLTAAPRVGILLPSSVGAAVTNIAVALLGKETVNLNYTAGAESIKIALEKAGIERILTSRKLLEKFPSLLPSIANVIYVEDVLSAVSKPMILAKQLLFRLLPQRMAIRHFGLQSAHSNAVPATIMFSSGSTGIPKGVVLSHSNVLANVLALQQVFDVGKKDRIIGVLPFFHSFGFTATLWFPLIAGFGAVYHSNPLDSKTVGDLTARFKATLLIATPTFLLAYMRKVAPEQFQSLRYVVTGAERLPETLSQSFIEKFGKAPLEGYGCTELSPVAAVNVPDVSMGEISQVGHKAGKVGHPIPGVTVKVVDPDSFEPKPQGEKGLLLVKGPNVMQGYLGDPERTREVLKDGWYVTGDLALIDNDGFIQIVDRLSRFSKIAGEMVPHVKVEDALQSFSGKVERCFVVTTVPDPKRGEQLAVLYAGYEGSLDELLAKLNNSGLPKLWIPPKENFVAVEAIPYLGSGKVDLAAAKTIASSKLSL